MILKCILRNEKFLERKQSWLNYYVLVKEFIIYVRLIWGIHIVICRAPSKLEQIGLFRKRKQKPRRYMCCVKGLNWNTHVIAWTSKSLLCVQEHEILLEVLDFINENIKQSCNKIYEADFIHHQTLCYMLLILSYTLKTHYNFTVF